jgi:hypothetical protein
MHLVPEYMAYELRLALPRDATQKLISEISPLPNFAF